MWYVAVQNIWSAIGQVQYYAREKEKVQQYIDDSSFELSLEELTEERFQQAKQNDWYLE